jgi:hypothetical protein
MAQKGCFANDDADDDDYDGDGDDNCDEIRVKHLQATYKVYEGFTVIETKVVWSSGPSALKM